MFLNVVLLSICLATTGIALFARGQALEGGGLALTIYSKLQRLHSLANSSILVHEHIPKAGGTALSLALSTECECKPNVHVQLRCKNCLLVYGSDGFFHRYSVSRVTGWSFGIHPPLAKFISLSNSPKKLTNAPKYGVLPVYIIPLREPFERFLSEVHNWAGRQQVGADWGIWYKSHVNRDENTPLLNMTVHDYSLDEHIVMYSALPMNYVLHNRHTKYIGGRLEDFAATFNSRREVGSIWLPNDTNASIHEVMLRAKNILETFPSAIVGVHSRFQDLLCVLEVLYGHLYRFHWTKGRHAHDQSKAFQRRSSAALRRKYTTGALKVVYDNWLVRNQADIELYKRAEELFDLQFQQTMLLLRSLRERQAPLRVPHCPLDM